MSPTPVTPFLDSFREDVDRSWTAARYESNACGERYAHADVGCTLLKNHEGQHVARRPDGSTIRRWRS